MKNNLPLLLKSRVMFDKLSVYRLLVIPGKTDLPT